MRYEQGPESALHADYTGLAKGRLDTGSPEREPHAVAEKIGEELLKITIPAHKPVKRSTLAHILKQARLDSEKFLELLLLKDKGDPDIAVAGKSGLFLFENLTRNH